MRDEFEGPPSASDLLEHGRSLRALARELLGGETGAEDLVQHAYLVALEKRPKQRASLGSWLRRILRHRALDERKLARRAVERERARAREELADGSTEERLAVRERVLAAVRALPEPYRTAIVRRYYDGLPPRRIALELSTPVKTVKTRLSRGIELLRVELDARHGGDRRAWAIWLAPAAGAWKESFLACAAAKLVTTGGIAMAKKLLAAALALLCLLGLWHFALRDEKLGSTPNRDASSNVAAPSEESASAPSAPLVSREGTEPVTTAAPAVLPPEPIAPYGSLLVRATWGEDGAPAAEIGLNSFATLEPSLDCNPALLVSDAKGEVRFPRVHAGRVRVSSDRGGAVEAEVEPGAETIVDFALPQGVTVSGNVVDERELPVPGARIWISSPGDGWLGGRIVARADDRGRFAVRGVGARQSLGALASGYAPSGLVDLELAEIADHRAEIRLVLAQRGARLEGRVVDAAGHGIEGALVAIGPHRTHALRMGGSMVESWNQLVEETDASGAFRRDDVAPGAIEISVRAEGYALGYAERTLSIESSTYIEIVLEQGATVRGTVTDAQGQLVPGALLAVSSEPEDLARTGRSFLAPRNAFGRPRATADEQGRYVLGQIPAGEVCLLAVGGRDGEANRKDHGTDRLALRVIAGVELEWNPRLSQGLALRVRVQTAEGTPPTFHPEIRLEPEVRGGEQRTARWDDEGKLVFEPCADLPYTLIIEDDSGVLVRESGLRAGGPEIEITLPELSQRESGTVTGSLAASDAAASVPAGFAASLQRERDGSLQRGDVEGPAFRFDRVSPGRLRVVLYAGDAALLATEWFELAAGETRDLGALHLPLGGAVEIELVAKDRALPSSPRGWIGTGLLSRELRWVADRLRAERLPPGRHALRLHVEGLFAAPSEIAVEDGATTRVAIELEPGTPRGLEIHPAPGAQWDWLKCRVRDGERTLWETRARNAAGRVFPIRLQVMLPHRSLQLEAEDSGGRKVALEIAAPVAGDSKPIVIDLDR